LSVNPYDLIPYSLATLAVILALLRARRG